MPGQLWGGHCSRPHLPPRNLAYMLDASSHASCPQRCGFAAGPPVPCRPASMPTALQVPAPWWPATPPLCSICACSTFTACSTAAPHDRRKLPALEKVEAAGRLERSNSFCSLASDDGADGEMGRQTPAIAAVLGAPLLGWHVGWVPRVGEAGRGRWRNRHAAALLGSTRCIAAGTSLAATLLLPTHSHIHASNALSNYQARWRAATSRWRPSRAASTRHGRGA